MRHDVAEKCQDSHDPRPGTLLQEFQKQMNEKLNEITNVSDQIREEQKIMADKLRVQQDADKSVSQQMNEIFKQLQQYKDVYGVKQ